MNTLFINHYFSCGYLYCYRDLDTWKQMCWEYPCTSLKLHTHTFSCGVQSHYSRFMCKFKSENIVFCFFIILPIDWMRISIEDTGFPVVGEVGDAYFPHIYIFVLLSIFHVWIEHILVLYAQGV